MSTATSLRTRRSSPNPLAPHSRAAITFLLLLLALDLAFIFVHLWKVRFLLGVVEDGGEMVVMSLIAWYVFLIYYRDGYTGSSSRYVT